MANCQDEFVNTHMNIGTCFDKPVWIKDIEIDNIKRFSVPNEILGFRGRKIPEPFELKLDVRPEFIQTLQEAVNEGKSYPLAQIDMANDPSFTATYTMSKDYKEKLMKKRKYFKFKFITLEREDSIIVDGNYFSKNNNGLEGYGYRDNTMYFCTAKAIDDEDEITYRALRFDTDYFFKEKVAVTSVPCEFIEDLK